MAAHLVSFNGGGSLRRYELQDVLRGGARGGEAGGRLDLSSEDVRARSTSPKTGFPRGPAVHKHNLSRSARRAERTHWSNEHPPSVLVGVDSTPINCIQPPSLPAPITRCRASEPAVQSRRDGLPCQHVKLDSCVVALHCTRTQAQPIRSQFLIPCSLGSDSSRQISVFHPLPLFHWMREIGASRSGHICTPSHLPQPFHWVQHRRGLSNTDMSLAAKAHHGILPTCLGGNLGQIVVDITSISLSSWYSARHTVTALYRRLLRTSVPALLPRHATGQRVHTAHAMYIQSILHRHLRTTVEIRSRP